MAHAAGLSARVSVGRPGGRLRLLGLRALHVFVLTSLSIALPAFLVAGAHFFITRGSDEASDVLTAVVVIGLGPPVVLVALDSLAELVNARLGAAVHLVVVGFLAALFASQLLYPDRPRPGAPPRPSPSLLGAPPASRTRARVGSGASSPPSRPCPSSRSPTCCCSRRCRRLVIPGEEAASAASTHSRTPVVVVVFDELPGYALMGSRGRIDAARFPAFGRLARDSTWYRNATTSRSDTELAVPTLVTGRYAPVDSLPIAADHPRSLFTLLGREPSNARLGAVDGPLPPPALRRRHGEHHRGRPRLAARGDPGHARTRLPARPAPARHPQPAREQRAEPLRPGEDLHRGDRARVCADAPLPPRPAPAQGVELPALGPPLRRSRRRPEPARPAWTA